MERAGLLSAGRFLPVQDQRPAHGAQVVSTSLYRAPTAPCGIIGTPARLVRLAISRRGSDLVTRCDLTG